MENNFDEVKEAIRQGVKKAGGDMDAFAAAQKERLQEFGEKQIELQARLQSVEQVMARRPGPQPGSPMYGLTYDITGKVVGSNAGMHHGALNALLNASAELKAVAERKSRRAVIELPSGFFNAAVTTGPGLGLPEQLPGIVGPVKRRMTIRQLIPSIPTTGGSVQYTRETSFNNQAAPVSETIAKPESGITFELKTAEIATIAHWIKCSNQVLADTPQLMQYIDGRLRYGLAHAEELQLLKGSGVGNNLEGMMTLATPAAAAVGGDTKIDRLRRVITQLEETDFQASGIVLNPTDWLSIALIKDLDGNYIVGSPGGANPPMLWNLPVVSTSAMTAGDFLVADFPQSALLFDREQARLDIATENEDDFKKNMALLRAEERIGLAILRAGGLIKGTF